MARWFLALTMGLAGTGAVLATLQDPGLTIDESLNVVAGARAWRVMTEWPGWWRDAGAIAFMYEDAHDHPPLARFILGAAYSWSGPSESDLGLIQPRGARWASAIAYGVIAFLVVIWSSRLGGLLAGLTGGVSVLLLPRLFGQSHFAAPEVISAAAILMALFIGAKTIERMDSPRLFWILVALTCLSSGIALLTKLTAILVVPALGVVFLLIGRKQGMAPAIVLPWGCLGTFVLGWPWLWPLEGQQHFLGNALQRFLEVFGTVTRRSTIYVEYFGQQFPHEGHAVPWHYVWVYFLGTIPIGILFMGLMGIASKARTWRSSPFFTVAMSMLGVTLAVFSLPIERYDGERLFLFVFPIWAVLAGVGCVAAFQWMAARVGTAIGCVLLSLFLASQSIGIVTMHPYQLSYYNALLGGLSGAHRLGLEATYWGDTLSDRFLDHVAESLPENARVIVVPTLYQGYPHYLNLHEALMTKKVQLSWVDQQVAEITKELHWAIVFNRGGYIHDPLPRQVMEGGEVVVEEARDGVWLSRLYRMNPP